MRSFGAETCRPLRLAATCLLFLNYYSAASSCFMNVFKLIRSIMEIVDIFLMKLNSELYLSFLYFHVLFNLVCCCCWVFFLEILTKCESTFYVINELCSLRNFVNFSQDIQICPYLSMKWDIMLCY